MRFAAFVMGFLLMIAVVSANARPVGVKAFKGKYYSDILKRACKPSEWKEIQPFLAKTNFDEREFPEMDFEITESSIVSESEKLKVELGQLPRWTIEGQVFDGTICEVAVQIARQDVVARFDFMGLLVPRAEAREVLKTEVTNWDRARWIGAGVAGGGAAIALGLSGVGLLASGGALALAGGYVTGDMLRVDMKVGMNRTTLEDAVKRVKSRLSPAACTPSTVVLRAPGGIEVTLDRSGDKSAYFKNQKIEGRLRASFSAVTRSLHEKYKNCTSNAGLTRPAPQRQQVARVAPAPRVTTIVSAPPVASAEDPMPTVNDDAQMDQVDDLFEIDEGGPATAATATSTTLQRSSN